MSDTNPAPLNLNLSPEATKTLQDNLDQANKLMTAIDALESAGMGIPGAKDQVKTVKNLTQALLEQFGHKG